MNSKRSGFSASLTCVRFVCLLLLMFMSHAQAQTPKKWEDIAAIDLQAMHDLIRDNHPGSLNPDDPQFSNWLDNGEQKLLSMASTVHTPEQYRRFLRTYANGFADGHLGVGFRNALPSSWPGFLTRNDLPGDPARVVMLDNAPGVQVGDELVSCGEENATDLLEKRVLKPRLNPKVFSANEDRVTVVDDRGFA